MEYEQDFKVLIQRLNRIGIALSTEHNVTKLLEMIVSEIRNFTRSDGGSLYIKEGNKLSFEVAQNDTITRRLGKVPFKSFKIPLDHKSIAGYVASTGKIINISDLDEVGDEVPFSLKTMREFDQKTGYKSVSMVAVPMRNHKDEIIGVIQLINSLDAHGHPIPFNNDLVDLITSLASQAAVAICNSRLIQDIKKLFESIVTYSAQAIDARSPQTAGHSERVAKLVMLQAECINNQNTGVFANIHFTDEELNELLIAAWLHDIGKIGVSERVLDKVNKLSGEKIEAVINRFSFIKKDIENKANLKKLSLLETVEYSKKKCEQIDAETKKTLEDIDADLALILKLNIPNFYLDEDRNRLEKIAKKKYTDINRKECPFIEPYELENLRVRKGNLIGIERKEVENHVIHTLNILKKIPFTEELKKIPTIAAAHHEMLNGTGYPNKLTADKISLQSRIIAVADIYDALTAQDRPYKPPMPLNITLKILKEEADTGRLDKNLVDLLISEKIYEGL